MLRANKIIFFSNSNSYVFQLNFYVYNKYKPMQLVANNYLNKIA